MDQIAAALSHYWHLRSQDVSPDDARAHVRQRFGVEIGPVMSAAESGTLLKNADAPWEGYGSEFIKTTYGSSTGPQDGLRRG